MATLVNNLLQFSRRSHAQISTVNVGEEIRNSVEFIHYYLRNRKVNVIYDLADDLLTVPADRQQLRQLFLNLLTNASDAMPLGGGIEVKSWFDSNAGLANIRISDTGPGIDASIAEHIFDHFVTTKDIGEGTGLGLAIVKEIVESHRGTVRVESNNGSGTAACIAFPADRKASRAS